MKTCLCPSLSGKSRLTYEIGFDKGAEIHVRVIKNSGSGWFSPAWVALPRVHDLLARNGDKLIAFSTLLPLFKGKSVNNAGFLLAVLKHEGLVAPKEDKPRCHVGRDTAAFLAGVQALAAPAPAAGRNKPRPKAAAAPKTPPAKKKR